MLHGTDEYDSLRTPAWCDRILYKAAPWLISRLHSTSGSMCASMCASSALQR